ncbi:MAG: hypothetical protein IJS26_05490 [Alphaproteobacteria bacterium]|nr:hypothetical protein [Alphaproteobacteria bacterium]
MSMLAVNRVVKSREVTLPAPIMGLNKKDPVSAMQPLFAIEMDNYIPLDSKVELRSGYTVYSTLGTQGKIVKTLAAYHYPSHNAMFAVYNGKIWDVSTKPSEPEDLGVTLTEDYCQTVQYKNYLYFMNGVEQPQAYYIDGNGDAHIGAWGFSATGLTDTKIVSGSVSKEFLWFVEKGTLKAWYAATAGSISGTLNAFDLAQVSKWGGELMAVVNWTIDGGTGIDDYTGFITSEGEVFVYSGSNPNDASNWTLKGSYKISKPIGYRCTMKYQGDIVIICQDGYFPMSKALAASNAGDSIVAFSDNIRGLVINRTSTNSWRQGWQPVIYNKKGYGIFNVPVGEQFEQHVINVATGAWCRFTGIRAFCWCLFDGNIYFGGDDGVFQFDNGYSDNGIEIEGVVEQAYNDFSSSALKKISLLNPRTASSAPYSLLVYVNMDYRERKEKFFTSVGYSNGTKWNTRQWAASWDLKGVYWSADKANDINSGWIMHSAAGVKASVVFKTKTRGLLVGWYETGIRYEQGTGIV